MLLSFWFKILLVILRILECSVRFRNWDSGVWNVVSASKLQMQSWLMVSSNECLNSWSQRWLKFTRSSMRCFIPLGLWHRNILFGAGLMNWRTLSSKGLKFVEFRIAISSLFHSIMVDGRGNKIWKYSLEIF